MDRTARLLEWYDRNRRDLPWRRETDPYRIWLSEVMLQQTRVDVVVPYYRRFLERFPTVEDLGAADVDEVLGLWSGLGYYRRARQLHAAARKVAADGFPDTVEDWKRLPGVGDYTAAAVASIAFGAPVPVLDGNVERVLCRLHGIEENPKRAPVRRRLFQEAGSLVDRERPGDSNQALMELGATVCTPAVPQCPVCPLAAECLARFEGRPESYPVPRKRRVPVRVRQVVVAVERAGRLLLFRRGREEDLLAGTWELPWAGRGAAAAVERELAARYGGTWCLGEGVVATVRHSITHRVFEVEVRRGRVEGEPDGAGRAGWFARGELPDLATSSLVEKVGAALDSAEGSVEAGAGGAARRRRRTE